MKEAAGSGLGQGIESLSVVGKALQYSVMAVESPLLGSELRASMGQFPYLELMVCTLLTKMFAQLDAQMLVGVRFHAMVMSLDLGRMDVDSGWLLIFVRVLSL